MHDKRHPSGTLPGNGTESPDKLLLFLLFIVSSSAVVKVPSVQRQLPEQSLVLLKAHLVCWRSAVFMHNELKSKGHTVQLAFTHCNPPPPNLLKLHTFYASFDVTVCSLKQRRALTGYITLTESMNTVVKCAEHRQNSQNRTAHPHLVPALEKLKHVFKNTVLQCHK